MGSDNHINKTYTYPREGDSGMIDMQLVMKMFRCGFKSIGGIKVESVLDHSKGADGQQKTVPEKDALEYHLAGGPSVEIRPSSAESKIEVNITVPDDDKEGAAADDCLVNASEIEKRIREDIESIIYMDNRMGYCCE